MPIEAVIGARFVLGAAVGAGGMGVVHRGEDRSTGRPVAVKLLKQGIDAERFAREADILARLDDAHIVGYVAHGIEPDETRYLVMDWIEGPTVHERLAQVGFDVAESITLARSIARGLAAAHRVGVVHRDVKPSNVLLPQDDPGRARIADFGLGRARDQSTNLTQTGMVLGTPGYMAPEQALAQRGVDERADLFALGAILYECLTGRPAFTGGNALAVQCKVIAFEPAPVAELCPEVPPSLSELCERLLAKNPAERPPDAEAVIAALAQVEIRPGGPRRARRPSGAAVTALALKEPQRRARFVLMASAPLDDDGVPIIPDTGAVARAAAVCASEATELASLNEGGWLVVIHDIDEVAGAQRTARVSRALADVIPGAIIVVTGGCAPNEQGALDTLIEEGGNSLELSVKETLFGVSAALPGAIRIDKFTADLLAGDPGIVRVKGVAWLRARLP